jgi:hypothetical protein
MFTSFAPNAPWLGYSIPTSGSRHLATACGQQVERKRRIAVVRQPDHPPRRACGTPARGCRMTGRCAGLDGVVRQGAVRGESVAWRAGLEVAARRPSGGEMSQVSILICCDVLLGHVIPAA